MVESTDTSWWDSDPNDWITVLYENFVVSEGHHIDVGEQGLIVKANWMYAKNKLMTEIPVPLEKMAGDLQIAARLNSLINSPREITGTFDVSSNQLTSLEGGPITVGRAFICQKNQITSLKGIDQKITDGVYAAANPLKTLDYLPPNLGSLSVSNNRQDPLPLLKCCTVKNLTTIWDSETGKVDQTLTSIMNDRRWAGRGRAGSLACGAELARKGFKENARW